MNEGNIPREYSEEELIKKLVQVAEELSRQTFDVRIKLEEIEKQRRSTPVITSRSEPEPEPLKSDYEQNIEKLKKGAVEKVLQDWRARSRR